MNATELKNEIRKIIQTGIKAGKKMPVQGIVGEVLKKHPVVYNDKLLGTAKCDGSYAEFARYAVARIYSRKVLNEFKQDPDDIPVFPGFEHLQLAYSVIEKKPRIESEDEDENENGIEVTIVPTQQMTDDQLLNRAEDYERMGAGCYAHANEIRRFVRERTARLKKDA